MQKRELGASTNRNRERVVERREARLRQVGRMQNEVDRSVGRLDEDAHTASTPVTLVCTN